MRCWAAVVSEERFDGERRYAFDSLTLADPGPDLDTGHGIGPVGGAVGEAVAFVVAGPVPMLFGLGQILRESGDVSIAYTRRAFENPVPVGDLLPDRGGNGRPSDQLVELDPAVFARLASRLRGGVDGGRSGWFVSVALPIEATSRAEAVREFWTYVTRLGPRQLPAFVWPQGDELAMQAFVLGEETNLDPEEE